MAQAEDEMRELIKHGKPTGDIPGRLMQMRKDLVLLIRERDALGGSELVPTTKERLSVNHRPNGPGVLGKRFKPVEVGFKL